MKKGHWTKRTPMAAGWYWIIPDPAIGRGVFPTYVDRNHIPAGRAMFWTVPIAPPPAPVENP